MEKVILKSKVGTFETHTSYGGSKDLILKWNKGNDFTCEVPTRVQYVDAFSKQTKVAFENYAQALLNSYPDILELVEIKEEPTVVQPKPSKKEKKNETA